MSTSDMRNLKSSNVTLSSSCKVFSCRANVWMDDVSLSSAGRLFTVPDDSSRYCRHSGADDCSCSLCCQQFHGVSRAQMTSTGYCRDQTASAARYDGAIRTWRQSQQALSVYVLPDGELVEVVQYRRWTRMLENWWCEICYRPRCPSCHQTNSVKVSM